MKQMDAELEFCQKFCYVQVSDPCAYQAKLENYIADFRDEIYGQHDSINRKKKLNQKDVDKLNLLLQVAKETREIY